MEQFNKLSMVNNPPLKNPSSHWKKYKVYYLVGATFLLLLVFILLVNSKNNLEIKKVNQRLSQMQKPFGPGDPNPLDDWDLPERSEYGSQFKTPDSKERNPKWIQETIVSPQIQQQVQHWVNTFKYLLDYRAKYGPEINRHVLLSGPPGSGKSYLADQFKKNESCAWSNVRFETEIYAGSSLKKQKAAFQAAQAYAKRELGLAQQENRPPRPVVMVIEEIDSVGIKDMSGLGSSAGRDEVNGLLTMIDDIQKYNLNIVLIATTNYPDALDEALVRPGRFGRRIEVPYPTNEETESLVHYVKKAMQDEYGYKTPTNQDKWNEGRKDEKKVVKWPADFWDQAAQVTKQVKQKYAKVEIETSQGKKEEIDAEIGFAYPDLSQAIEECLAAKVNRENPAEIVPDINDYRQELERIMQNKQKDWVEKILRGKTFHRRRVPAPPREREPEN